MKLWSRGLGKTELNMDFRYYVIKKDSMSGEVCVIGKITDPVDWEFKITLGPEDIPGLIKMAFNFSVIKLVVKNLHRYVLYLFNWKKYRDEMGRDIEKTVNDAYAGMMKGRVRHSLKRSENDAMNNTMQAATLN